MIKEDGLTEQCKYMDIANWGDEYDFVRWIWSDRYRTRTIEGKFGSTHVCFTRYALYKWFKPNTRENMKYVHYGIDLVDTEGNQYEYKKKLTDKLHDDLFHELEARLHERHKRNNNKAYAAAVADVC